MFAQATWEFLYDLQQRFPYCTLDDKGARGNLTHGSRCMEFQGSNEGDTE